MLRLSCVIAVVGGLVLFSAGSNLFGCECVIVLAPAVEPVSGSTIDKEIMLQPVIKAYAGKRRKHRYPNKAPLHVISFVKTDPQGHLQWGVHYSRSSHQH